MSFRLPLLPLLRLDVSVLLGGLLGGAYAAVDVYLDHHIGLPLSRPTSVVAFVHSMIDLGLPIACGCLLGIALHSVRLRERIVELERQRADELSRRLGKIERDQAVWVISASLLHDLKTPLHAMGLLLDELLELSEPVSREQKDLLERARAQSERLAAKLQTLRSLPASRRVALPRIALGSQVSEIVRPFVALSAPQGIAVEVGGADPLVQAQPSYLKIILENLIDNALEAIRVRSAGGRVLIEVMAADSHALVRVTDDGPGVSPDARVDLFEPLQTRKAGGLGLGLSTSRQLARAMGGDLRLADSEAGACFELTLPRETP